ncbi:DUF4145 domain-containing protein [Halalkalibaculum sp. DA384]|uniref:DUF4145 domain-containing protein n=1 Tax=Halalkalibaculum sp. DA384 TaxID=3373606 RepID=UPI0037547567
MLFDSSEWKDFFVKDEKTTSWKCPTCFNGFLESREGFLKIIETEKSKENEKNYPYLPFEFMDQRFGGFLVCNNSKCGDKIGVTGITQVHREKVRDREGRPHEHYVNVLYPKFFQPEILFFKLPNNCPENISNQVKKSFSSYWHDIPTSGNQIRKSLELIMDEQGIKDMNLHDRIRKFGKKEPEISNQLMALKHIGNEGSHSDDLDRENILKAFEVLHFSLTKLYSNKEQKIQQFITQINTNKGTN